MLKMLRISLFALLLFPLSVMAEAIDINSADSTALEQVKGVGPAKAAAIVKYRDEHGPFASVDDLVKVPCIGERSLESLRPQVTARAPQAQPAQR